MWDYRNIWLSELLDCGYADVSLLEEIKYDITDLVEDCRLNFGRVELNCILMTAVRFGISDIEKSVESRIAELESEEFLSEEEVDELKSLKSLKPFEDIESFHNYLDSSVYFIDNEEVYEKYCQEALDEFYENTGFEIRN